MPVKPLITNPVLPAREASVLLNTALSTIIGNGFLTVDRQWTVETWNEAAEKMLGQQAQDIIGKNLRIEFAGHMPLDFYSIYQNTFQQDSPVHFKDYRGANGARFDITFYQLEDSLSFSFRLNEDFREPKISNNSADPVPKLKVLTEMYRLVTEVTHDALWEWDLQEKKLFWIDGGHRRLFGYDIENFLVPQAFWESCVHPDDLARVLAGLNKLIVEKKVQVWEEEYRFKKSNGEFAYVQDRGHIIYDEKKMTIRMIGATQDITEKILLQNKLSEEKRTKQKEVTAAVLTAQENERATIGMELHDNLNQILAVAAMYLQMAKSNDTKKDLYLEESKRHISTVIQKIRTISKSLVVPGTHIIGLFDNIKNMIFDLMEVDPVKIKFLVEAVTEEELDEKVQLNIFRIIQEQMNNVLKHSNATHAAIKLSKEPGNIVLLISDNGDGCDKSQSKEGVGIINIQSRADLYDGKIDIRTKPGEGYELKVTLPVRNLQTVPVD